ncbi:MAG: hypothetical protein R3E39_31500 [Anaerolineae bacterium]
MLAQADDCPVLVDAALKSVGDVCAVTGLNQACYGNFSVKAEPQPGIDNMVFNSPGDVTRVANLSSLTIDPLDVAKKSGVWR